MNTFNRAQRAYDAQTPADEPDATEDLTDDQLKEWLLLWHDFASAAAKHEVREFINAQVRAQHSEF